jgi:hypothetical protein
MGKTSPFGILSRITKKKPGEPESPRPNRLIKNFAEYNGMNGGCQEKKERGSAKK